MVNPENAKFKKAMSVLNKQYKKAFNVTLIFTVLIFSGILMVSPTINGLFLASIITGFFALFSTFSIAIYFMMESLQIYGEHKPSL